MRAGSDKTATKPDPRWPSEYPWKGEPWKMHSYTPFSFIAITFVQCLERLNELYVTDCSACPWNFKRCHQRWSKWSWWIEIYNWLQIHSLFFVLLAVFHCQFSGEHVAWEADYSVCQDIYYLSFDHRTYKHTPSMLV